MAAGVPSVTDKLVVAGIGLLMMVQNYSFFITYWDLWSQISTTAVCSDTAFWLGFDSFVCFYVTVMVAGMMLGAWIDNDKAVWWFFFFLHLAGGLAYTVATIGVGVARFGDDGKSCAEADKRFGDRISVVWVSQLVFYLPYCICMASLLYQVVFKKNDTEALSEKYRGKLMIGGIGLVMLIQNYSFFLTYWDLWSQTSSATVCSGTSTWLVFDSFVCFYVSVMVCGMVLGGWIDGSKVVWWLFFALHLVGGLSYTVATIGVGVTRYGNDGKTCAAANKSFRDRSAAVWIGQVVFYVPYCLCMASLAYQVVYKKIDEKSKMVTDQV
jgi:hypothetical protein